MPQDHNTICLKARFAEIVALFAIVFGVVASILLSRSEPQSASALVNWSLINTLAIALFLVPLLHFLLLRPIRASAAQEALALSSQLRDSQQREAALADILDRIKVQRTILDQHCLVSHADARGRITFANSEFCRISGYSTAELIGQSHNVVNSGHHSKDFWQEMYRAIARDGIWQGQVCNLAKDGTRYWVQSTNVAERDESGAIVGYISVHSDITETKKREEELGNAHADLKEAIERAEAASSAKSGFLSTMSHEMRTPLNGIIGAMELLRLEPLTDRQNRLIDLATQSGEALLVHINDVLDFSKMEAGKLKLVPKPFNLNKLISSVVEIIMPQVRHGSNEIVTIISPDLPVGLVGDLVRLRQILLNFVSNAAKFTRNGSITITVAPIKTVENKSIVEFAVTDSGIGIPAARLGELFREFTMVDSSYSRQAGGTGLGLAISKNLAEMMGGRIGVESQEGHGSRFWFTAELPHAELPVAPVADGEANDRPLQRLQILLVDDNSTNRLIGGQLVAAAGSEVTLATCGREAVAIADVTPFDLILMDISMPGMDGLQATHLIRTDSAHNRNTPIIALTAHAVAGDKERFLGAGMNGYLSKPIRLNDLRSQLARFSTGAKELETLVKQPASDIAQPTTVTEISLDAPVLDMKELSSLAEQLTSELLPAVIETFLDELSNRLAEVNVAVTERNLSGIQSVCHAISGAASSVGALNLSLVAKSIERDCAEGLIEDALSKAVLLGDAAAATQAALHGHIADVSIPVAA